MAETVSGDGPWKVYLHQGRVVLVEVLYEGKIMQIGMHRFDGRCARCGGAIKTCTPENDEMAVCKRCESLILAGVDD